ncbi:S8 family peptidase [bacterium]|nr:S8 family peptidase [bacterium]
MRKFFIIVILPVLVFGLRYRAVRHHNYQWVEVIATGEKNSTRRREIIHTLKDFHRRMQRDIVEQLSILRENGDVQWFRPLWIADVIVFEGNQSSAQILRKNFPEYEISIEVPQNALIFEKFSPMRESALVNCNFSPITKNFPPDSLVWNTRYIGIRRVWKRFGTYGDGVLVAAFDTGIDRDVRDIADAVWHNSGEGLLFDSTDADDNGYFDDVWGYNFYDTTSHPYDDKGHGTHLSGTIAGKFGTGLAPNSTIVPLKVLNHSGVGNESDVWLAIEYSVEIGALVGNFSIGWRHSSDPPPDRETWRTVMQNAIEMGFVPCVAAGNEGGSDTTVNDLRTPGDVPEVITVGAVDSALARATFSSIGPVEWDDFPYPPGLIKPDICAYGTDIVSTVLPGGYEGWDGTSMATPHITAIATLMRQINPELSSYEIRAILESTAVDLGAPGKDNFYGSGMVNIFDALMMCAEMETVVYSADVEGTLFVYPQRLRFFGSGDTIFIPQNAEYLVFLADGFYPETLEFSCESESVFFSPDAEAMREVRVGIMDFESGDVVAGEIYVGGDTISIPESFGFVSLPDRNIEVAAAAEGYTSTAETLAADEDCIFFFLHHCIDFEDSGAFEGTMDWEWGEPEFGLHRAHSGNKLWATARADTYRSSSNSWLTSDWCSVESTAAVFFWHWFDCEATNWGFWDGGNVLCDFGDGWEIVYPIGDYNCHLDDYNAVMPWEPAFSGTLTGNFWHQEKISLFGVEEPCSVRIAFHFSSDDNTTRAGWFIDDVCIAERTVREPIVRSARIASDTVVVSVYGVSAPLDDVHFLYIDETTSPMERFACDSFLGIVQGEDGDTVRFKISAVDVDGREAIYPDSFLTAVKPTTKITEFDEHKDEHRNIKILNFSDGFEIRLDCDFIEIFDVLGKRAFFKNVKNDKKIFWRPESSGIYFIKFHTSDKNFVSRVSFIR